MLHRHHNAAPKIFSFEVDSKMSFRKQEAVSEKTASGRKTEVRNQRSEVRGQKSEVRGQRSRVGS
jgi:hypothetical protein